MVCIDDINDMWESFYSILQSCLDTHVPLKKVHSKYFKRPTPWITPDILAVIKAKYKAKRAAERTHNPINVLLSVLIIPLTWIIIDLLRII